MTAIFSFRAPQGLLTSKQPCAKGPLILTEPMQIGEAVMGGGCGAALDQVQRETIPDRGNSQPPQDDVLV